MSSAKEKAALKAAKYIAPLLVQIVQEKKVAVVGVGTGSTVSLVMKALEQALLEQQQLAIKSSLICIPTSFQSQELILQAGLKLGHLVQYPELDLAFDGADEVDSSGLYLIKGGGGAHLLEKIVAYSSRRFIVIVDHSKMSSRPCILGEKWTSGIPMSVLPEAVEMVRLKLLSLGFQAVLRTGSGKMGPIFSDQGHILMDLKRVDHLPFDQIPLLCQMLDSVPGILGHGLFANMSDTVIVGDQQEQDCIVMEHVKARAQ